MTIEQWKNVQKCIRKENTEIPLGLIIDSPWLPGFYNMSTIDFLTIPDIWLKAYTQVRKDYPEVIFFPDFWVEYGMGIEPSGFGCLVSFSESTTPTVHHIMNSADNLDDFLQHVKAPNPYSDGLMPLCLSFYKYIEPRVKAMGEHIKMVAARGPLTLGSHQMGLTEFLMALKLNPDSTKKLLKLNTDLVISWLTAQSEVLSEVEGILVLDDVVGFLSKEDYFEFAHPYLKQIMDSFPNQVKMYHNDTDNVVCYPYLEELGIDIFNFTHKQSLSEVRRLVGENVCLFGNIPPLEILAEGTPSEVSAATKHIIKAYGRTEGFILSAGGGASPGTPEENLRAFIHAART